MKLQVAREVKTEMHVKCVVLREVGAYDAPPGLEEEMALGMVRSWTLRVATCLAVLIAIGGLACGVAWGGGQACESSFPARAHSGPVFGALTRHAESEPRMPVARWQRCTPLFGVDVEQLQPGNAARIDGGTLGDPMRSLRELPAGDYYVQAIVNVYTEFHRTNAPVIWAHNDQWEGQRFNRSPGNLISEVQLVHLDPAVGYAIKLSAGKVSPAGEVPADREWVKHIKIQSKLLSDFWGTPIYLGAVILLPKGYDSH